MPLVDGPRQDYTDRLKDYTDVKQRVMLFYAKYPEGRLVTNRVELWTEVEPPRVVVQAFAYRSPDDPFPGVGWSWMTIPGIGPYQKGSEVENTETSAWGRAIGSLGIGITKGIASVDEIAAKDGEAEQRDEAPHTEDGSLIGEVVQGTKAPVDMELRREPDGTYYVGFVLTQGRSRLQVVAVSPLAESLAAFLHGIVGQRVSVWGSVEMVPWRKGDRDMPPYKRLRLERIQTADWTMPAPMALEAASVPLFPEEPDAA